MPLQINKIRRNVWYPVKIYVETSIASAVSEDAIDNTVYSFIGGNNTYPFRHVHIFSPTISYPKTGSGWTELAHILGGRRMIFNSIIVYTICGTEEVQMPHNSQRMIIG